MIYQPYFTLPFKKDEENFLFKYYYQRFVIMIERKKERKIICEVFIVVVPTT